MENPLTIADATALQRAKAEEIEELTATIVETTQEIDKASQALDMLNSAVNRFAERKGVYDELSYRVRKKIQKIASEI